MYLGEIGFSSLLTAEDEIHYARLALKGDVPAKNKMIEAQFALVEELAKKVLR